jgi:predicted O-methyltransferase YrrM
MEITHPSIDQYISQHSSPLSETLNSLARETQLKVMRPRMLSGEVQGKFLELLVRMSRAENILEIGTYTGYSAICMASALLPTGQLHTIDINAELQPIINKYVNKAQLNDLIHLHIGNAIDIIPELDIQFDFVFMDADKVNYLNYYNLLIDRLKSGALIIADNVLWSGKVVEEPHKNDHETEAIQAFNQYIQEDQRVENVLLPLRDGLMIIRKK